MLRAPSWLAERSQADSEVVARIERDTATFFTADTRALLTWQFDPARAVSVTCPVLYIGGADNHPWFIHVHRWVKDIFPHCEDYVIADARHFVASTAQTPRPVRP